MTEILQFGTGKFLRGFFCPIVKNPDSIIVVQSRVQSSGAAAINGGLDADRQRGGCGGYHVWTRGKLDGQIVDDHVKIDSIDHAIVAGQYWDTLQQIAQTESLHTIVSNTTEQGLTLSESDGREFPFSTQCPASFPAKLLALLHHRFVAGLPGLTIVPFELVEFNADRLKQLVIDQAVIWGLDQSTAFMEFLNAGQRWLNNLVDRIVVDVTEPEPWGFQDKLAVVGEPYRLLAIQQDGHPQDLFDNHPMIQWVNDLTPVFRRKVRILNGLHTAMVAHSLRAGFETVVDAVNDSTERKWLNNLLENEILPVLAAGGEDESDYAEAVLERFENPFFQHRLRDIANGHAAKLKTRIQPTVDEFRTLFGRNPELLGQVMNS